MKQQIFTLILLILTTLSLNAQEFLPFASSNYAGVTGVHLQPASIADSRYKFDLNIASVNVGTTNNFYRIDPYVIWNPKTFKEKDFWDTYVTRNLNGDPKSAIINLKADVFSFMITLSDKDAIAFTPSVRGIANVDNMTETMAVLLDQFQKDTNFWENKLTNEDLSAQVNTWVEYGFTYARVVLDKQKHFLKAGATLKINQGIGSGYMFIKDLNYEVNGEDTISFYNSYANYGLSENLDVENLKYRVDANPSVSFDFGVVYEYRPDWMKYKYDMDGETNLWRRDQEKYLFRIGFTASDLGNVRYRKNPLSMDFTADIHNLYTGNLGINSPETFNHFIDSVFDKPADISDRYNMTLPANLSLQLDVRVAKGFYVNFTPYLALNRGSNKVNKVHTLSAFNLVPRYDRSWFGVSLPVQYTMYKQWNVGLSLRLGQIWIGSNDLFSMLMSSKNRYGFSACAAFKIPLLYKRPHDRDNDKISDKKDDCPDLAGIAELNGCPDADLDGVTDEKDKCPDVAGLKEYDGCPDSDGDGVVDLSDLCPDVKGLVQFKGCPDSDGDSIIDQNDACPFNAGSVAMSGCPDQDEDGITDKDDNCPTVAGTRENKGCPFIDTDGDGITDDSDNCPGVKGPVDNKGCPYQDTDNDSIPDKDDDCPSIAGKAVFKGCPDTDGDGISDKYDLCPTLPGVAQNNGCPEIKKEEQEILTRAFSNLEFETGKSIIRTSSFISLDELVSVLKKRSEFKLSLTGHTDNVGKPESNLNLSKNRTLAVKDYLVKKGVEPNRIRTEWFGQTKPIAPNTTPEGRQQNRRVEMNIVFD